MVWKIPLHVLAPPRPVHEPLTAGLCLPKGMLRRTQGIRLADPSGRETDVQAQPLAWWPDGSIQWLLVDFWLTSPGGPARWWLSESSDTQARRPSASSVALGRIVRVDTGTHVFEIDRTVLRPFLQIRANGAPLLGSDASRIAVVSRSGRSLVPRIEEVGVERHGPVRTTLRFQGMIPGSRGLRFRSRLCFFRQSGLVRMQLSLHNPNRARHRGGLWDLGDAGSRFLQSCVLELALPRGGPVEAWCRPEAARTPDEIRASEIEIYQDSSGGENWQTRNHKNRYERVPCRFRGYRLRTSTGERTGHRATPVMGIETDESRVTAAVPHFWQQFPKSIEASENVLRIGLFPHQFDDVFELQGGERATHTVWLLFERTGEPTLGLDWVHQPARVMMDPEWSRSVGWMDPWIPPGPDPDPRLDALAMEVAGGPANFLARRETIDEYGWRNFGDVHADHEARHFDGPQPVISHYNNQYDPLWGFLLQFLRTGDPVWPDLAEPLARHVMDIDVYHTQADKAAYAGGLFWHTYHYRDAGTATHRCYTRAARRPGEHSFGGGPSNEHNYTTGLACFHWLTGDPDAKEAAIGLADWVLRMDDGRRTVFGLIAPTPTGLASQTADPGYHGPGRGCGNSINALLDGWRLSGHRGYLQKAEELLRRSIHPADDIDRLELLDVERRWSYTVFLQALDRYLRLKEAEAQLDSMYAYGRAALLHYAEWMLEHERPYFDRPESLEFPTETWAAQELRKANVLLAAARYAPDPLRARLRQIGNELVHRAWQDLYRFQPWATARAVAILLVEAARTQSLRCDQPAPAFTLPPNRDFGLPSAFVPQRGQLRKQFSSVAGVARALLALVNPVRCWRHWWIGREGRVGRIA